MAYNLTCYCGATSAVVTADVLTVAACHCGDCRRWTGAPLPAFAAFPTDAVPADFGRPYVATSGAVRRNCPHCGSPMAAEFPYLPGQTYVPVGVIAEAADLIIKGINGAISAKTVTYDFERLMEGATLLKCSEFGDAIVEHMG